RALACVVGQDVHYAGDHCRRSRTPHRRGVRSEDDAASCSDEGPDDHFRSWKRGEIRILLEALPRGGIEDRGLPLLARRYRAVGLSLDSFVLGPADNAELLIWNRDTVPGVPVLPCSPCDEDTIVHRGDRAETGYLIAVTV